MKKTLLKDTFKEIKNTLSRFLGILLIVALGTAFFVGIKTTCPDMKLTGDKYYKNQNFMDFRLASTTGFTSADVASIRNIKGIKGVMPSYYLDAFTSFGTRQKAIRVISLPENSSNNNKDYINRPELIKGRLPQKSGECVIETSSIINLTLGSKIKLTLGDDSTLSDKLIKDEFTVVGIVRSPLYISKDRGTTSIGSGQVAAFMEIPESDFNLKYYNNISLTVNIDTSIKAYSKRYDNITSPIMSSLQAFADKKAIDLNKQINVKNQIGNIPSVKWYVFDRTTNSGYVEYGNAADRMDAIAQVFPVLFILVAILICFTSMSRMVEEQRQYMGTLKALGYNSLSIASKFITYAAFASILGGMLGLSIGFTVFPSILNKAYSILYTLPKLELIFDVPFAIISLVVGLLVTTLSALLVCIEELNSNAAYLMRPRSPKPGKVILLEKIKFIWKRLKFTPKVTMRNLFRYKIRFFMTMIGIGGCTALLLVGFGLNDAIRTIGDKQFGEIYTYQMSVNLKDNISLDEKNEIENALKSQSEYSSMENFLSKSLDIGFKNTEKSCNLMVPENIMDLVNYINLRDRITNKSVPLKDDGVILTEKVAKTLGVKIGDEIYIKNGETEKFFVKVTGICETYLQHYIYMSSTLYEKLYTAKPDFNQIDINLNQKDSSSQVKVGGKIASLKGASSVNLISDNIRNFKDTIKSIYNIVLVLIVSAALLSFIVLFTLTNININERMREIATIKVLGFYDKEVSHYVFRENIILTFFGTCFGLFIGKIIAGYVIGTAEVDMVMFGRIIYPSSYFISAILTIIFALVVNSVMMKRLKDIDMVEALKTVE